MSDLTGVRRLRSRRRCFLYLALLVGLAASPARAEAIRHHTVHSLAKTKSATVSIESAMVSAESVMNKWEAYFTRALQNRSMHVVGPNGVKLLSVMVEGEGGLPDNAFVRYLEWRHGLDTVRFDEVHPGLGTLLESSQILKAATVTPTSPFISPPVLGQAGLLPPAVPPTSGVGPGQPVVVEGQSTQVPEPTSLMMAAVMLGSAVMARRWSASRT